MPKKATDMNKKRIIHIEQQLKREWQCEAREHYEEEIGRDLDERCIRGEISPIEAAVSKVMWASAYIATLQNIRTEALAVFANEQ